MPTETVYGLAADATNAEAVARIYEAKGRPSFNPLIVHVPDLAAAARIGVFDDRARELAEQYWPGPLTLVVPLRDDASIASIVTAGLPSIGLRVPAHAAMQDLTPRGRAPPRRPVSQCERFNQPDAGGACPEKPWRAHPADHRRRGHPARPGIDDRRRDGRRPSLASSGSHRGRC